MIPRVHDWRPLIVDMVAAKEALRAADVEQIFPFAYPELAATEDELVEAERRLGFSLEPEYRAFLGFANGWRAFLHETWLFGTRELITAPISPSAFEMMKILPQAVIDEIGYPLGQLRPIGSSEGDIDIWLMPVIDSAPVIWLAGGVIDTYETFGEFFASMILYNQKQTDDERRRQG